MYDLVLSKKKKSLFYNNLNKYQCDSAAAEQTDI